jgi:hypothetical protein
MISPPSAAASSDTRLLCSSKRHVSRQPCICNQTANCTARSTALPAMRRRQRLSHHRQCACCSAAVKDSRCSALLLSCPCMQRRGPWSSHTCCGHGPPSSRGIERVEGLREDVDAAISQAVTSCLTETDLPYRPRTVVGIISHASCVSLQLQMVHQRLIP